MKTVPIGTAIVLVALIAGTLVSFKFLPDSAKEVGVIVNVLLAWLIQSPIQLPKPSEPAPTLKLGVQDPIVTKGEGNQ